MTRPACPPGEPARGSKPFPFGPLVVKDGGFGRFGDRSPPIPADLVYAQYAYHGAGSALLSRIFVTTPHGPTLNPKKGVETAGASRIGLDVIPKRFWRPMTNSVQL